MAKKPRTTDHSFFAVECSLFPPSHLSLQHVYARPRHVRLVLEDLVQHDSECLCGAHLAVLWVVQRGRVVQVLDLRDFVGVKLAEGWTPLSALNPELAEGAALSCDFDRLERDLPVLLPPLLEPGQEAVARLDDESLLPEGFSDSYLFERVGASHAFKLGSIEGASSFDDITPHALRAELEAEEPR